MSEGVTITELGCAGHLIVSRHCHWRRHTQVGKFRVSTVGDYYLDHKRRTVGGGDSDYFETMVFMTTGEPEPRNDGCGCLQVTTYSELDCERYATAGEAQAGHERMIAKYAAREALERAR